LGRLREKDQVVIVIVVVARRGVALARRRDRSIESNGRNKQSSESAPPRAGPSATPESGHGKHQKQYLRLKLHELENESPKVTRGAISTSEHARGTGTLNFASGVEVACCARKAIEARDNT